MNRNTIIAIVVVVVLVLLACCCVVGTFVALTGGCALLGVGGTAAVLNAPAPYGMDGRPAVPAGAAPDNVFPRPDAGGYRVTETHVASSFAGLTLPGGVSVIYDGPGGRVTTFGFKTTSESQAQQLVARVGARVDNATSASHLSRSLPGKPYFVQWHVGTWKEFAYGIVWNNGPWVFGVASESQTARDAVADSFPY
jgi:hypothetical protein